MVMVKGLADSPCSTQTVGEVLFRMDAAYMPQAMRTLARLLSQIAPMQPLLLVSWPLTLDSTEYSDLL